MEVKLEVVVDGDLESINAVIRPRPGVHVSSVHRIAPGRLIVQVVADSGHTVDELCRNLVFDGHVEAAFAERTC